MKDDVYPDEDIPLYMPSRGYGEVFIRTTDRLSDKDRRFVLSAEFRFLLRCAHAEGILALLLECEGLRFSGVEPVPNKGQGHYDGQ